MKFRFKLFDYTNSDGQTAVEIVEPIGFDGLKSHLERHPTYKGAVIEFSYIDLEIDDKKGFKLISEAYEKAGVNAKVEILIELQCGQSGNYELVYNGTLGFNQYEEYKQDYCSAKVNIAPIGCIMDWKYNEDVKVDLQSLKAFDGVTDLQPYEKLGFDVEMPSKTIVLTNKAVHDDVEIPPYQVGELEKIGYLSTTETTNGSKYSKYVILPFPVVIIDEMPTFQPQTDTYGLGGSNPSNFPEDLATYINTTNSAKNLNLKARLKFWIQALMADTTIQNLSIVINIQKQDGVIAQTPYSLIFDNTNSEQIGIFTPNWSPKPFDPIDIDVDFTIQPNERLFIFLFKNLSQYGGGGNRYFNLYIDNSAENNFIQLKENSTFAPTPCKQFMINEVFSRIVEASTNNCMRVFSDYFGRTDAQPYPSLQDGCGGLTSITKGLFIRQVDKSRTEDTQPVFSLSFKEVFEALDAIYNIGMEIVPDINRNGHNVVRIENADYFYQDEIILDLGEIGITKKIDTSAIYNILKFGYEKWEAEEYNGLDEFLTKREYKQLLNNKKEFSKLCRFIASGYAIEITRRKSTDQTKDWRYDEDTFIVCLKRSGGNVVVEQGAITGAENIIDPPTLYNVRISPIRNLLRWIKFIFNGYKNIDNAKAEFSSGDGNYFAKGKYTEDCVEEINIIAENETINKDSLNDYMPIYLPEIIKIDDLPLSYNMYNQIKANPHGLVRFTNKGKEYKAYIREMEYLFAKGTADFELIPKY